jgi:hypothetical protein
VLPLTKIVISQPFFFPWIGLFEQIRLADVYVHYDDAQFPLGRGRTFINRVEVKTPQGPHWLTVPVLRPGIQLISDVVAANESCWRDKHRKTLMYNYAKAPFVAEMMEIVDSVYALKTSLLCDLNIYGIERVSAYFGFAPRFCLASSFGVKSSSSVKVLELVQHLNGDVYITGHGAKNYLDHELFERNGVQVEYMNYQRTPYPQLHGEFNPHVSILDLIANLGRAGREYIHSSTTPWREFVHE